jgi:hypothetical protein
MPGERMTQVAVPGAGCGIGSMTPIRYANATNSIRDESPSLVDVELRCVFTVDSSIEAAWAMALFVRPSAASRKICRSRVDNDVIASEPCTVGAVECLLCVCFGVPAYALSRTCRPINHAPTATPAPTTYAPAKSATNGSTR